MSGEATLLVGVIVICVVVACVIVGNDIAYKRDDMPITKHAETGRRQKSSLPQTQWPPLWPHDAPRRPLDVPEAHRVMQRHRECLVAECPRKAAAYRALVDAGRITPRR